MASGIWHLACQTYALNLIDSQGGQSRAPQLFSSSKSFRVAKLTPSSGSLPPISKRLSKPPLLSKSALFFAPLLLLSYTQGIQALTAYTSRVIEGSAPYLTFDGGRTKATNTDTFLAIELPDGRTITPSTNTSSSTNPIMLPSGNFTFNDIHMVIPSGSTATSLNSLISQGKWGDDDGDGQVTATGNVSVSIYDKDGRTVSRGNTLSICSAPYKVTLSSTGGSLATQYGIPNSSTFSGGTAEYYITLPSQPVICYARPNLVISRGDYAIWNPDKGFSVRSTSQSSQNFPTTGADGLYFDLVDIIGVDESQLSWTVNTGGSISATVSWTRPRTGTFTILGPSRSSSSPSHPTYPSYTNTYDADAWIRDKSKNVTRVTLHGPRASSTQMDSSAPNRLTRPSLPQTFELVGRDRSGHEVKYRFVLKQWFVHRGNRNAAGQQRRWCSSLGYKQPSVRDLTNAVRTDNPPISGATPSSSGNYYMRHIGAGFFTEWGSMYQYVGAEFINYYYLTRESNFNVASVGGSVYTVDSNIVYTGLCVAP